MWRCVCGHAFYSALPPRCPSCDRVVDADVGETVTVDGRRLPFRVWEAEVLVSAAGWTALLRGSGLFVGGVVMAFGSPLLAIAAWALGGLLFVAGLITLRRGWASRWLLMGACVIMVPLLVCSAYMLAVFRQAELNPIAAGLGVLAELIVDAYVLFVVLSSIGDWVWEMGGRGEPIAPFSSTWRVNRSLKAWAAAGVVGLSLMVTAFIVLMIARLVLFQSWA